MALNTSGYEAALKDLDDDLLARAEAGNPRPHGYYEQQFAAITATYIKTGAVTTTVTGTLPDGPGPAAGSGGIT